MSEPYSEKAWCIQFWAYGIASDDTVWVYAETIDRALKEFRRTYNNPNHYVHTIERDEAYDSPYTGVIDSADRRVS